MRFCGKFTLEFLRDHALPCVLESFGIRNHTDMSSPLSKYRMLCQDTLAKLRQIKVTHIWGFFCPFQWATLLSSNQ